MGVWVFDPKLDTYESFKYGSIAADQQLSDETVMQAFEHPFKIDFKER